MKKHPLQCVINCQLKKLNLAEQKKKASKNKQTQTNKYNKQKRKKEIIKNKVGF
jgi:hypothetical protein